MGGLSPPSRRDFLATLTGAGGLAACTPVPRPLRGGFHEDQALARGHALRERLARGDVPTPDRRRRTRVLIVGAGVTGLAAARALRLRGMHDLALLELSDAPGGNSRGMRVGGLACPFAAHYLPVPGDAAPEVQDWLEELGLRQRVAGRWRYDERHLCHSPQERLFLDGHWQDGLLPIEGVGPATLAQYQRFAARVADMARAAPFVLPVCRAWGRGQGPTPLHLALDAQPFATWLDREGFHDSHLRWYLDYACRDDYGAGSAQVSAWAGLHYFASRHGFHAPGEGPQDAERDAVLTWPEGNGWLAERLAAPLRERGQLHLGRSVWRVAEGRHGVTVHALDHATGQVECWESAHAIVALPVFVAARVVQNPPGFLRAAAQRLAWSPWLLTHLHLDAPLQDRPGAAPAWDNVLYADPTPGGLGYVDAGHQRLDPRALATAPTVLTYYQALGDLPNARAQLLSRPWTHWAEAVLAALARPHPDLRERLREVAVIRHGHAMAQPRPGQLGFLSQIGLQAHETKRCVLSNGERTALAAPPATPRLRFAHADWSGYSVFEEAFTRGHHAGLATATG